VESMQGMQREESMQSRRQEGIKAYFRPEPRAQAAQPQAVQHHPQQQQQHHHPQQQQQQQQQQGQGQASFDREPAAGSRDADGARPGGGQGTRLAGEVPAMDELDGVREWGRLRNDEDEDEEEDEGGDVLVPCDTTSAGIKCHR
jgi:hypothetical protein